MLYMRIHRGMNPAGDCVAAIPSWKATPPTKTRVTALSVTVAPARTPPLFFGADSRPMAVLGLCLKDFVWTPLLRL